MVYALQGKKKLDVVFAIIGSILLFFMGTRGPIIVYLFFVAFYLIFVYDFEKNNVLKKIIIGTVVTLLISFSFSLMRLIAPIAASIGFSTRVFDSFLGNEMFELESSSYRDDYYSVIWSKIINDPLGLGYGLGTDRLFTPSGVYTHNFELEILCQFGLCGGGLIIIGLLILLIKCYIKLKGTQELSFWLTLLCCGLGSLQLSHSYITYPLFFVLLGYCTSVMRLSKKTNMNDYSSIAG
jgi:O-antigen ligase